MKKIFIVLFSCIFLLAACSSPSSPNEGNSTAKENSAAEESSTNKALVMEADVVVIGGGGAGLTAAIEAHDAGAKVIVIEKMPFVGGNTVRSKGGLNAAETSVQKKLGINDSVEAFYKDTMEGGKNLNDPELVKYFTENSAEAVDWLISIGMDLGDVAAGAGATNPRMHRPTGGKDIGAVLIDTLSKNIKERKIETLVNTTVTEITGSTDQIKGIKAVDNNTKQEIQIKADSVVVATGGFAANEKLYTKYREDLKGFITTNHTGATGDGIIMAEAHGAGLVDMEQIQTNPTVEQSKAEVISESIRGLGAIFVNQSGNRFTNEMLTRDVLSAKILEQEGKYTYILFDQQLRDNMGAIEGLVKKNLVTEGNSIEELAAKISIDAALLQSTIDRWNAAVANKKDEDYGRETGMDNNLSKAPYYVIKVAPGVHHTMGGIKINTNAEVLKSDGTKINGLYAAGEAAGGVHGANRLGGNAVADIIIYGRQAGIKSAELALKNGSLLGEQSASGEAEKVSGIKEGLVGNYKDGTYSATAKGNNGDLTVEIAVKDGFLQSVEVKDYSETGPIFSTVEEQLIPAIIYEQSTEQDVISGATNSSQALMEAVNLALEQAK
ncbi:Fumarate reductase flavoprotein subunit precursor [compost metagenome]